MVTWKNSKQCNVGVWCCMEITSLRCVVVLQISHQPAATALLFLTKCWIISCKEGFLCDLQVYTLPDHLPEQKRFLVLFLNFWQIKARFFELVGAENTLYWVRKHNSIYDNKIEVIGFKVSLHFCKGRHTENMCVLSFPSKNSFQKMRGKLGHNPKCFPFNLCALLPFSPSSREYHSSMIF